MRINKYLAASTPLSRRGADAAVEAGRVTVDGHMAQNGTEVTESSQVKLDGRIVQPPRAHTTIMLHKPVGYVCSRNGQGSRTVFELLPPEYQHLQPVGRLDKDSSGLLLLTDDGELANQLTHPRYAKTKVYEVTLDKPLAPLHQQLITDYGITLEDGPSRFAIAKLESRDKSQEIRQEATPRSDSKNVEDGDKKSTLNSYLMTHDSPVYEIHMQEGRNRQIRRTFAALGYTVTTLHRTQFGRFNLGNAKTGTAQTV